jgi:uncharacterized protein with FMN-binding domain
MTRSSLLLMSIALAVFGISTMLGHPPWGAVTGTAFVLTAAAMGAGAFTGRSRPEQYKLERTGSAQRLSNNLAALSATAILAIYTAGYYRTREAAEKLEAQSARRPIPAVVVAVQQEAPTPVQVAEPQTAGEKSRLRSTSKPAAKSAAASNTSQAVDKSKLSSQSAQSAQSTNSETPSVPETPKSADVAAPFTVSGTKSPGTASAPALPYKDGAYSAWGTCRHGDLEATVVIDQGKIASAKITQCLTRYPCSWIAQLPGQVVSRQAPDVDYVSGATQSTDAYYQAVAAALAKALE